MPWCKTHSTRFFFRERCHSCKDTPLGQIQCSMRRTPRRSRRNWAPPRLSPGSPGDSRTGPLRAETPSSTPDRKRRSPRNPSSSDFYGELWRAPRSLLFCGSTWRPSLAARVHQQSQKEGSCQPVEGERAKELQNGGALPGLWRRAVPFASPDSPASRRQERP